MDSTTCRCDEDGNEITEPEHPPDLGKASHALLLTNYILTTFCPAIDECSIFDIFSTGIV